jgi:hypothetical protein
MEITVRGLWTLVHGMGFGGLYLLAFSGALVQLIRLISAGTRRQKTPDPGRVPGRFRDRFRDRFQDRFVKIYLVVMVVLAWSAVLTGTYVLYPWYRAAPAPGATDLTLFPQYLLLSSPKTSGWHNLGMEWKEHVAWLSPIAITLVAYVVLRYGHELRLHRQLRRAVLSFAVISFVAAGIAGFFGAMIDKAAPVQGGRVIVLHSSGRSAE